MHFSPTSRNTTNDTSDVECHDQIIINGKIIKEVQKFKFLGVIVDNKLAWTEHIAYLQNKLKIAIGVIKRLKPYIPVKTRKTIYHSLFGSHLTYCISVWGGIGQTHIDKLFRLQKRCMRILFGKLEPPKTKINPEIASYSENTNANLDNVHNATIPHQKSNSKFNYHFQHTKPLFSNNEILTIQNLYTYQTCIEITKLLKYRTPISIHALFQLSTRDNSNTIILPKYSNCFAYRAAKIWNIVSKIIAKSLCPISINMCIFKHNLKSYLLQIQNLHDEQEWTPANFCIDSMRLVTNNW